MHCKNDVQWIQILSFIIQITNVDEFQVNVYAAGLYNEALTFLAC